MRKAPKKTVNGLEILEIPIRTCPKIMQAYLKKQ